MNGEITWAGTTLSSLATNWVNGDVLIEHAPETNRPARKLDRYEVPGRNGDVIVPQSAWENVTRAYDLVVYGGDYDKMTADLMSWLYAPEGYQRLTDTFDTAVYRKAYVSNETDIENIMTTDGRCTVAFECDPRRFLTSGESTTTITGTDSITNPTAFEARPVMTVHGSGSATIECGGNTITISSIVDGMVIDCNEQNAYKGTVNYNNLVSGSFPVIPAGAQTITVTGGVTTIDVVPNWWTL